MIPSPFGVFQASVFLDTAVSLSQEFLGVQLILLPSARRNVYGAERRRSSTGGAFIIVKEPPNRLSLISGSSNSGASNGDGVF